MFLSAPPIYEAELEDLLWEITRSLCIPVFLGAAVICWSILFEQVMNVTTFLAALALMAVVAIIHRRGTHHRRFARYIFMWSITLWLIVILLSNTEIWWVFLGLPAIMASVILLSYNAIFNGSLILLVGLFLTLSGERDYPLLGFGALTLFTGVLSWATVETLYVTLHWTKLSEQRASALLTETRKKRAEVQQALESLEKSNAALRRTQIELRAAHKEAEDARQLKEQFAANISHELRTPLNLVLGFTEVMHLTPEVYGAVDWSPTLKGDIYQIYRSSRHLLDMIDDILDLSRFQMSSFRLNKEPTSIRTILEEGIDIAKDLFRERRVQFQVDLPDDLPVVKVDKTRIRQVILNLINNAFRFTETGFVRLMARADESEIRISIQDSGQGIPAEKIPLIFEEFYQIDGSLNRRHGGTGLGLAISKKFVESHGGKIWVESRVGVGSTFTFTIPVTGEKDDPIHLPLPITAEEPQPAKDRPVMLVIDSDPQVADMVKTYLDAYEVVQVDNLSLLADAVSEYCPDLILHNTVPHTNDKTGHAAFSSVPWIECSLPSRSWILKELNVAASFVKPVTSHELIQAVGPVHDVLIIDDDPGFAQLVERLLQTAGNHYNIRSIHASDAAIAQMHLKTPDVLLLDLTLSDSNGVRMLDVIQNHPMLAQVPVIVLSATNYAEDLLTNQASRILVQHNNRVSTTKVLKYIQAISAVLHSL